MQLGRTSVLFFVSRISASMLGFLATLYIARELGAAVLGVYSLILGLVSWLSIASKFGTPSAVAKRVSEGREQGAFVIAGAFLIGVLIALVSLVVYLFRGQVNTYVGSSVAVALILILVVVNITDLIGPTLQGLNLVEIQGYLTPVHMAVRSGLQIGLIFAGLGLLGLLVGYAGGYLITLVIGVVLVYRRLPDLSLPNVNHIRSLVEYARFAWISDVRSKAFNWIDIVVLGFFVPTALIGIYAVAWNIAQFLLLFSSSIAVTIFPEMSRRSANEDPQAIVEVFDSAVTYAGLLLVPGLVGSVVLGERLLRLYGSEFTQGVVVLDLLIAATLVQAYQNQVLTTLNAIDRPDLSFRVNALFLIANLALNLLLIYLYGWIGAAVATGLSALVSLVAGLGALRSVVEFSLPVAEIGRQWISAGVMGIAVLGLVTLENNYGVVGHNAAVVVLLVGVGAAFYFFTLLVLSRQFRLTVRDNLPILEPYLIWE